MKAHRECHEQSIRSVILIVGVTVLACIAGILYISASSRVRVEALTPVTTILDRIATMGLGALIALLANPSGRQSVTVDNPPSDPVHTDQVEEEP